MLKLKKLVLQNWCQHKKLEVEFSAGLNAIMGRNGAGKSNILRAVQQALRSSSAAAIGVKDDDVSWGEENGKITLEFEIDGRPHTIKRAIKGSSVQLTTPSGKITGATAADNYMQDVLAVSTKALAEVVFVAQGRVEDIIFQRPAERTKTFHSLLGLDAAEKIRLILTEKLAALPCDSNAEFIAQLQKQLEERRTESLEAVLSVGQARTKVLADDKRAAFAELLNKYEAGLLAQAAVAKSDAEIEQANKALTELNAEERQLVVRISELQPLLAETRPVYDKAVDACNKLEAQRAQDEERRRAQAAEAAATQALVKIVIPELPPLFELTEFAEQVSKLRSEYTTSRAIVDGLDGKAVCPTCLQEVPLSFVQAEKKKLAESAPRLQKMSDALAKQQSERCHLELAVSELNTVKAARTAELKNALATLQRLGAVKPADAKALEDFKSIIASFNNLTGELNAANGNLAVLKDKIARAGKRVATAQAAAARIPLPVPVSATEAENAKTALKLDDNFREVLVKLQGSAEVKAKNVEDLEKSIAELKVRESKLDGIRRARALFEEARGILHRDQLPALAARAFLTSLNAGLNAKLESFGVGYSARINDDLSFECLFPDSVKPADRLSGGEKVALAVSMRFALHDLLAANLGLLVLDEPTNYLDKDNIECLVDVLEKVKARAHASGLQVIVVTHEEQLARVFDKLIRL